MAMESLDKPRAGALDGGPCMSSRKCSRRLSSLSLLDKRWLDEAKKVTRVSRSPQMCRCGWWLLLGTPDPSLAGSPTASKCRPQGGPAAIGCASIGGAVGVVAATCPVRPTAGGKDRPGTLHLPASRCIDSLIFELAWCSV